MGQPVAVVEKRGSRPGLVRFEANRNLTGMGHERFTSPEQAVGDRPAAVLARRLFETGCVDAVHIYLNVVTVDVRKGYQAGGLKDIVENLYIYYRPGFVPPAYEEPVPEEAPAADAGAAGSGGGDAGPALSAAAQRVPAHLLERSRLAKERSAAKQAG
jgi:hypothetical protein